MVHCPCGRIELLATYAEHRGGYRDPAPGVELPRAPEAARTSWALTVALWAEGAGCGALSYWWAASPGRPVWTVLAFGALVLAIQTTLNALSRGSRC